MRRVRARVAALRSARTDAVVVLPPSFSSALPGWLAGVRRRIGFRSDARALWLTHGVDLPGRDVHLSRSYDDLAVEGLRSVGLSTPSVRPAAPRPCISDGERRAVGMRLPVVRHGGDGYIAVFPGAAFGPAKAWPAERYRALCKRLAPHVPVVLAGSRGDRPSCEEIARGVDNVSILAGETSLGELFALIEGAAAVVANDSGAPHVAAALGIPCVVLFGSTSPAWTAPLGQRVRVLQHPVHCNPCFRRTCPTQLECFHGIEVEAVVAAVEDALAAPPEKPDAEVRAGRIESSDS